jgi:hypothetical protein
MVVDIRFFFFVEQIIFRGGIVAVCCKLKWLIVARIKFDVVASEFVVIVSGMANWQWLY